MRSTNLINSLLKKSRAVSVPHSASCLLLSILLLIALLLASVNKCQAEACHMLKLPSGAQVQIISIGPMQTGLGEAWSITYKSKQYKNQEAELQEVWQWFKPDADKHHAKLARVKGITPNSGPKFFDLVDCEFTGAQNDFRKDTKGNWTVVKSP